MANSSNDGAEIIATLVFTVIGIGLAIAAAIVVLGASLAVGAAYGGCIGLYNYGLSLIHNISMEKPIS